jgi:hypothetical protein
MKEDEEVERLFALAPEAFVAERDQAAARLRRAGDAEAAARVKTLRRPSLAVWAVNQLARTSRADLDRLLAAGERLRAAHQAALAGGGAAELRAAARAERQAVDGLVGVAVEALTTAGHPVTDATRERVAASLHAAAADPAAAELLRRGRLTRELDPAGFGAAPGAGGEAELPGGNGEGRGAPARRRRAARAGAAQRTPAARAKRRADVAAIDAARRRARLAADQAVLATRHAERLGRLADQAEREAARARATAAAAIDAAAAARERANRASRQLADAEDRLAKGG